MGASRLQAVVVTLAASRADRDADREALVATVATVTGVDVEAVRAGRVCSHCGSTDHGRPWATAAGRPVGVSLAVASDGSPISVRGA